MRPPSARTAVVIRDADIGDAPRLADIYNHFVLNTTVTFEEEAVTGDMMAERCNEVRGVKLPYLVAHRDGAVVGYAYATKWKGRCAYRFSAEVTVYVDPALGGRRIGSLLYAALLPELERNGIHAAIGGIALPNEASIRLHEKFGFTQVATFREVGWKFGRWIDVGYWQRLLTP